MATIHLTSLDVEILKHVNHVITFRHWPLVAFRSSKILNVATFTWRLPLLGKHLVYVYTLAHGPAHHSSPWKIRRLTARGMGWNTLEGRLEDIKANVEDGDAKRSNMNIQNVV